MDLRERTFKVQKLEQSAADKAGMRLRLIDEARLVSKDGKTYAQELTETILADIWDEVKASAELGSELGEAVATAKNKVSA